MENNGTSTESHELESDNVETTQVESSITYHLSDEVIQRLRRLSNDALHDADEPDNETADTSVEE